VSRARVVLALAMGMALLVPAAPPAGAHAGDQLARPIFQRMKPSVPEIDIEVVFTANYQFVVTNPTPAELTIMANTGEPFLRIGPQGVFGNLKSKSWHDSNAPEGLFRYPKVAEEGPDVEPVWRQVAVEPSWGWYDHRLHPVERYLTKDVLDSLEPVKLGNWKVPVRYGDRKGEIAGYFEYKPVLGTYKSTLKSPATPAEGVKVQVVSSRTVPGVYVENSSSKTVTVLGKDEEPFIRIGPAVEVNLRSPLYVEIQQARGETPTESADAKAPPNWKQVQQSPRWSWIELRAAPPNKEPTKEMATRDSPTTVRTWRVPMLIGEERTELVGITQFVPIAQAREAARGGDSGGGGNTPLIAGIGLAAVAVGYAVLRPKKKKRAPAAKTQARRRSRSTPKFKR
jgi:hypothetical protein